MKRKVFNMFMVGALVLPSASMFVSCKDYDDDINNLQQQIDELSKTIKAIQDQIAAGSVITNVTPTGNGVTITLSNNKTFTITNGKDGAAGAAGTAWTIGADGYWVKDGVKTDYYALGTKGDKGDSGAAGQAAAAGKDGIYYVPNANGFFDIYNGDGTLKEATQISWMAKYNDAITAVKNDGENTLTLYNVQGGAGDTKTVVIDLSSKLYALQLNPDFYYQGLQAIDCATFDYKAITSFDKADKDGDLTLESKVTTATPDLVATYFLNPSNAKMDYNDLSKYSFVAFDKKTRATDDEGLAIKVTKAAAGEKGSMIVKASYNSKAIKDITGEKATFIALQYNGDGNGFVTSDLAALRATKYTNPTLTTVKNDDFDVLADGQLNLKASEANILAYVPVNSTNGVNLVDIMSTKMTSNIGDVVPFTSDMLKDYGFEYMFTLVDGNDYASCENGVLKPVNKPATIGKSAIVRVELKDNNNNKIAKVGYLKINIVDKKAETKATVATKITSAVAYNVFEQKTDADINIKETDWNVDAIVNLAGVSAANFATNYTLVTGDGGVKQFKSNVKDADKNSLAIGKITFVGNKFAWKILSEDAYKLLKDGKKTSLTTSVCYVKDADKTGAYDSIYVNFEWTPKTINVDNTINLADYYTEANWVGSTLTNTVVGNEGDDGVAIDMAQSLNPFKNDITLSYSFAENQAEGFSVNGATIQYAAKKNDPKVNIAKISGNKIQLLSTGKELLNAKKVDLNVVAAAQLGTVALKVNNATFTVKFRPQINVTLNSVAAFTDKMNETRNLSYETSIPSYANWGLTGITLDTDNCIADVDIAPDVLNGLFTYTSKGNVLPYGTAKNIFGELKFTHAAGDFAKDVNVTIPVKFAYGWGVYETSITVKINKVNSGAKRN